jgi:vacuolar-type H+-ATPase catalytic subunit A/Vma1
MLINTVQEEDTQGVSSIQGASGDLVDADTGEDGNGTWDEAQAEFLERFESMPDESLQAQARSGAAWNSTLTPAEAERGVQQRNLKLSDIQAASPDSGSFTTAITSETSKQFSGLSSLSNWTMNRGHLPVIGIGTT